MKHLAYVGLGSNLQQPRQQLQKALLQLQQIPECTLLRCSSFYGSTAVGPGEQPDYINAVAALHCDLQAEALLEQLQRIEHQQGRERGEQQWIPRTLDLDLLLFDQQVIDTERLQVPHPRLKERNFVVLPLLEIAENCVLPDNTKLTDIARNLSEDGLWRLD